MKVLLLITSMLVAFSAQAAKPLPICTSLNKAAVSKGTATQRLNKFLDSRWKYLMNEYPEWATYVGIAEGNDRWTDLSKEAQAHRDEEIKCALVALKKIPRAKLKGEDRINYDLSQQQFEDGIEAQKYGDRYLQISQLGGLHTMIPETLSSMPMATVKDYENMIARLDKVPPMEEQNEMWLREGMQQKITAVKMLMARVPMQFDRILTEKVEDSPLYTPFKKINADMKDDAKLALQKRAADVIQNKVYPSLQKFKAFIITQYIPACRESIAATDLPNGKEWYAFQVRTQTTTKMTPDELHELGLKEVARITKEMEAIKDQVKFKGDLKAFNKFLLTDPQFFYTDKESLLAGYRSIGKRIDPELTRLFGTLPRLTWGVQEMPEYQAKDSPAAYYIGGSLEAGRAGYFRANTYDLKARPKWGMEALTLHEAVPGHHLQIALQQELKGLPEFRKFGGDYTAFVEGWALYAESLGSEMGMYEDVYSRYGQLSYEVWRAIRLVVDTGMHSKGWTRQQAIDYFGSVMPKAQSETENEVDRYITWPGQALAYKVGQLKFRELRDKAHAKLGDKFNIREFHDQVLSHGALPMGVLEKSVNEWMDAKAAAVSTTKKAM